MDFRIYPSVTICCSINQTRYFVRYEWSIIFVQLAVNASVKLAAKELVAHDGED